MSFVLLFKFDRSENETYNRFFLSRVYKTEEKDTMKRKKNTYLEFLIKNSAMFGRLDLHALF